ncbi:hypothetical protein NIES22_38410 [Calothrix brevissima NIES-22]|nr:hypothetical protein NIES22_38410 [Calothrix brevissima NIES-22]
MKIRQLLAVVAVPFVIASFGFAASSQANAEVSPHENQQIAQQQPQPQQQARPQIKHRQPRPQQKKRVPQPHSQQVERNQVRQDNR